MTETHYARVKRAAYETNQGHTEITVIVPGRFDTQPGELVGIITKESKK